MKNLNIAVAAALSLALAVGCKRPSNETSDTTRTTSATPGEAAQQMGDAVKNIGVGSTTLASGDVDFMKKAAQGGMLEVKLSTEAAAKATRPDVKAFASRVASDHGAANAELKDLAAKKGVNLPTQLDDDHTKELDSITKLSGPQFDDKYTKDMVEDHEQDVKDFQKASTDVKDPDLKAWAASKLSTLNSHLQMAKDLEAKKGAAPQPKH